MSQRLALILIVGAFAVGSLVGVLGYVWLVGGSGEPSAPISAPTLSLDDPTDAPDTPGTQVAQLSAELSAISGSLGQLGTQVGEIRAQLATQSGQRLADSATQSAQGGLQAIALGTQVASLAGMIPDTNPLSTQVASIGDQVRALLDLSMSSLSATPEIRIVTSTPLPSSTPSPTVPPTRTFTPSPTPEPTSTLVPTDTAPPPSDTPVPALSRGLYRIVAEQSTVTFTLTEDLFGSPQTVVGRTNQVAGDIIVDFGTPANSRIGVIRVNARTLLTDNEFRNRAIRSQILQSSQDRYEFIDFTARELLNLPDSVQIGDTVNFQVTGDLKIRDIIQPVTFDVSVTIISETQISGTATAGVTREDFDLQIPNAPGVANVSNEVELRIEFVANQVQE